MEGGRTLARELALPHYRLPGAAQCPGRDRGAESEPSHAHRADASEPEGREERHT